MTEKKKTKIIVIGNQKGGCGKTTISVHLACGLVKSGGFINNEPNIKLLVVNADLQKSVNMWADNKEKFKFDIISATDNIVDVLGENNGKYDYIIIDCPPATDQSEDSLVTYASLLLADLLLIPLKCSSLDVWATGTFESIVEDALNDNKNLRVYILVNEFKPRLKRTKRTMNLVKEVISYPVLESKIGERESFVDSADFGVTVFELGDKKAIKEVEELTKEVVSILSN